MNSRPPKQLAVQASNCSKYIHKCINESFMELVSHVWYFCLITIVTTRMTTARSTTEMTNEHAHITTHSWTWTGGGGGGGNKAAGRKAEW